MTDDTLEPETFTAGLRRRLEADTWRCPTCHHPTSENGVRGLAERVGVPHTVLWRFLRGGDMTGRNIDLVVAFLEREEPSPMWPEIRDNIDALDALSVRVRKSPHPGAGSVVLVTGMPMPGAGIDDDDGSPG